jgi:hypothetical protein
MKHLNNSEEWIENYLDGKLNNHELRQFDEKRATDPEFNRLFEDRMQIQDQWTKASTLDKTRKEVAAAIYRVNRHRRKKLLALAAAASLLLAISIPGVLYLNGAFTGQTTVADKTEKPDTAKEITITPHFRDIEEKAAFGIADTLSLLAPVNNQQCNRAYFIVFRWKPVLTDTTHIVIENIKNNQVIFKEKIASGKQNFVLEKGFLPVGKYRWYMEGGSSDAQFEVITINEAQ